MKPSEQVKAAGLKNLKELSTISKVSCETLVNWSKNRPDVFRLLIAGVVADKYKPSRNMSPIEFQTAIDNLDRFLNATK